MKRIGTVLRTLIALTGIPWFAGCQSYSVADLMNRSHEEIAADIFRHYGIPGASVAIIDEFTVKSLIHYGVKERGTDRKVDGRTGFQAASISKPVTSIGIMSLIQRRELDLYETDVNSRLEAAALAHEAGGKRFPSGPWHAYPELAAAGLWISASDLAEIVVFVQKSVTGRPPNAGLLSAETAEIMLSAGIRSSPLKSAAAVENTVAHGFFLIDRNNDGRMEYFSHGGSNWGYRSIFIAHMQAGYGVVVLTNSDNGNAACSAIVENIGKKNKWEGF